MSKVEHYRRQLRALKDWRPFLLKNSGLPGPRGNLELAQAFAQEASRDQILGLVGMDSPDTRENTPGVFLVFCGVSALGRLIAAGESSHFALLRRYASDTRWRVREGVAMALQTVGDVDMRRLLKEMRLWTRGNWYEKRAAAAALAEPRLLRTAASASSVLKILDQITASMLAAVNRSDEDFRTLRQGMGYCWSVAVVAAPSQGKPLMKRWLKSTDPDVRWVLKENLKKSRLLRMDPKWVESIRKQLDA